MPDLIPTEQSLLYILYYRHGNTQHTDWKHFNFKGSFRDAIERGKAHCQKMNLRFISVKPFLSDLVADEARHVVAEQ